MKNRLVQILLAVILLAGVTAGGVYAYRVATKPPEFTYRTVKVDRGNIIARVTATGTLSAHVTVQVGCQVSGRIAQLMADFNSQVKKGQVVAKIDPELFQAAVAQSRANRYQAEGTLAQAKAQELLATRQLDRAKLLRTEGLNSQADYDTADTAVVVARAQIEAAKGNLEQARAQEHSAEINLAYTTIVSPIDGTVISRGVDVGQTVAASLSAPTLFTIAEDLHKMQVDTNVTEGDVGKLKDGMSTTFLVDAYPNERFRGKIQQIRNAAISVQNVVTYDAVIDVENGDLKLKPGMTANVTMVYDRRENVLRVPNAALRFRPPPALAALYPSAVPSASAPPPPWAAPSGSADAPAAAPSSSAAAPAPSGSARPHRNRQNGGGADGVEGSTGGMRTLWVLRGLKPEPISVRVGLSDGTLSELLSGDVQEGDALLLEATSADDAAAPAPASTGRPPGGGSTPRMRL